jgi:hypothetical protein
VHPGQWHGFDRGLCNAQLDQPQQPVHREGCAPATHDLSGLDAALRSHGGRGKQRVPRIVNRPAPLVDRTHRWRNFDVFDLALNEAR